MGCLKASEDILLPWTHNSAHVCGEGDASAGFVLGAAAAAAAQRVPPDDAWGGRGRGLLLYCVSVLQQCGFLVLDQLSTSIYLL